MNTQIASTKGARRTLVAPNEPDLAEQVVMRRVQEALGVSTLREVAERLGENVGTVKSWSQRDSIPLTALIHVAEEANCSLDWLVRGVGSRYVNQNKEASQDSREVPQGSEGGLRPGPIDLDFMKRVVALVNEIVELSGVQPTDDVRTEAIVRIYNYCAQQEALEKIDDEKIKWLADFAVRR